MRKKPLNVDSLVCCVLLLGLLSRWSNHVLCLRLTVGISIGAGVSHACQIKVRWPYNRYAVWTCKGLHVSTI